MNETKRKGLEKRRESLVLAVADMDDTIAAAADLLADTGTDAARRRALETAIAVSYMRPYISGAWQLPRKYVPRTPPYDALHERLGILRNKVYAHSDQASGKRAWITTTRAATGELATIEYRSAWMPFPVKDLPAVQALCNEQKQRFMADAAEIHFQLGEGS